MGTIESSASRLGAGLVAKGEFKSDHEITIGGSVDGGIEAPAITVLEGGRVIGKVSSKQIVIHGSMNGSVRAHTISVLATGSIEGELRYEVLSIGRGAKVEVRCIPETWKGM